MNTLRRILLSLALISLGATSAFSALNDYFVTTDWLEKNRDEVVVVDVRHSALFVLGHIDGAYHVDKSEFLDKRRGVKSLVPTSTDISQLLKEYGITPDTAVVAYAEDKNPYSARFVWSLRYHGHENSFVLDGGYEKWSKEDRATTILPASSAELADYAVSGAEDIRAEADYILSRIGTESVLVWDTRRESEYLGTEVRADRGGHIPGVVHLEWTELQKEVDGVKVLKSESEILSLLATNGITPDKEIVAHCQTGIRSSYATLVLLGLGFPAAKNYDGSWIEWANDPSFPIVDPTKENVN